MSANERAKILWQTVGVLTSCSHKCFAPFELSEHICDICMSLALRYGTKYMYPCN